jgi:hypothetical protein
LRTADQDDDAQDDESHGLHAGQRFCFFVRSLSLATVPLTKTFPIGASTLEIVRLGQLGSKIREGVCIDFYGIL